MERPDWTLAERIGRRLYTAQARLGKAYDVPVHEVPWESLPSELKGLWIATAGELLDELGLLGLHVKLTEDGLSVGRIERRPSPRELGFSGENCEDCGSLRTLRTGACITCQDCGATSSCG